MLAAGEWTDPVDYGGQWRWWAVAALLAIALYYAGVLWFTRTRRAAPPAPVDVTGRRGGALGRIDEIEAQVRAGSLPLRQAHQQLSDVVRGYAEAVTPLPARSMTLTDLREAGAGPLADAVALMYPPEFAPGSPDGPQQARQRFEQAVHHARGVVSTWS